MIYLLTLIIQVFRLSLLKLYLIMNKIYYLNTDRDDNQHLSNIFEDYLKDFGVRKKMLKKDNL